jgi:hypothetical protein
MAEKFHLPIDDMPDLATAFGRFLVHWSFLEVMLLQLTAYILSIDVHKAQFVFWEFSSIRRKIVLLRRINHHCSPDVPLKEKETIDTYLETALKLNSRRNDIIHSFWVVADDTLSMVKTALPSKHNKLSMIPIKTTPQDVQNLVDEIAELSLSLFHFLLSEKPAPTR